MPPVDKVDHKSYVSLAQIYELMRRKYHKNCIEFLIQKHYDINYQIPINDYFELHKPEVIGCSALHLALSADDFKIFNLFLKYNADYNVKNYKQMSVLDRAVEENFNKREIMQLRKRFKDYRNNDFTIDKVNAFLVMKRIIDGKNTQKHDNWRLWGKIEDRYVKSILSKCITIKNFSKYSDNEQLSLFHAACMTNHMEAFEFFLKSGANVYQLSSSSIFEGFTSLHFAIKYANVEMVEKILGRVTNLFPCDNKYISPVDMLVDQNLKIIEWLHTSKLPYENSIIDYLENEEKLSRIMKNGIVADCTELSSFHVACAVSNPASIEVTCSSKSLFKLDKYLDGDEWRTYEQVSKMSSDSPWSGYTALHLAAFFNIETAKLLISNGADMEAKNKNGVTPFDILATRATIDDLHFAISYKESWKCITLLDGKTKLVDLIWSMKDLSTFNSFLDGIDINLSIPHDAPLWSGFTILHLIVTFSETAKNVKFLKNIYDNDRSNLKMEYENGIQEQYQTYIGRFELCFIKNADVMVQNAHGMTSIHLAFCQQKIHAVNRMLQHHDKPDNPTDADNLSHLHIACFANNLSLTEKLLSNGADVNAAIKSSFKWQCDYYCCTSTDVFDLIGATPLHLAISTGNLDLVNLLLRYGADANAKDVSGLTPLHRSFVLMKLWEAGNILYDERNASRFIGREPDQIPGYSRTWHALSQVCKELLSSPNLKESIVDDFGLSHLHVAVYYDNADAVEKLLDLGSDINAVVRCPKTLNLNHPLFLLSPYEGCTALQLSRSRYTPKVETVLLERGADFLITRSDGMNTLFDQLTDHYPENIEFFVTALKGSEELRGRLRDAFGWTILHVACQLVHIELASFAFSLGVDVNLRTNADSPLHPSCTALHILMMNCDKDETQLEENELEDIFSALLANGADVMLTDSRGNTALHRSDYIPGCMRRSYTQSIYTGRVLEHVKDFSVNPVNHEGISAFHIACIRHDVEAVTKFLDHGTDVNQPIEFFADYMAGRSPLHLAANSSKLTFEDHLKSRRSEDIELQLQTLALLLKHGADVNVKDAFGDTPLHSAAKGDPPRDAVFEMIVSYSADVNAKNALGQTPLQSLLSSRTATTPEVEFFLKQNCRLNTFNEITQLGLLSLLYSNRGIPWSDIFKNAVLDCPSIEDVDFMGRTAIHNIVSSTGLPNDRDHEVIGHFVEIGCNINRQDESGQTALHLAARFRSFRGVEGLLMHGADVNIVDSTGRTAFAYTLESESLCDLTDFGVHNHHLVIESLTRFLYHMQRRGLYLNEVNRQMLVRAFGDPYIRREAIEQNYEKIKRVKIGDTAFILDDFLSETGAIVFYSKIPQDERKVIEHFFTNTVKEYEFYNWRFLCKLQYKKALERAELVERAKNALNVVLKFPLPELCYVLIEKFLSNADLKCLIVAVAG